MNFLKKKVLPILLACIVILLAAVPQISVFAEKGTLGTENPVWKASFLDSDGNAADGNSLLAGEYIVNLNLYGMKTVSVLQISATYTDAVTVNSCKTIAQSKSALFRDIIKKENDNEFDAVVAAYNSDSVITAVDIADGETMVSLNITVNTPGDFANYFSLNTDPERTYIGADLGDGYDSAYTCVESADVQAPSDRKYYPNITHDMSPDISVKTYDVKGQITIATNLDGTAELSVSLPPLQWVTKLSLQHLTLRATTPFPLCRRAHIPSPSAAPQLSTALQRLSFQPIRQIQMV